MFARLAAADIDNSRESCSSGLLSRRTPISIQSVSPDVPGSPIALEFGLLLNRFWFLRSAQFMVSLCFFGDSYRPTFDCLCERYLTMIPCMLYAEDFRLMSYCVNWLFTLLRATAWIWLFTLLNFVHESSRFSSCSAEHLRIVSPLPRTPTRRRQSIDVYDHDSTCRQSRRYCWRATMLSMMRVNHDDVEVENHGK